MQFAQLIEFNCKICVLLISVFIVGCSTILVLTPTGSPNAKGLPHHTTPTSKDNISVIVQGSWIHNISWVGLYMAEYNGHYAAANLDVDIRAMGQGSQRIDVLADVAAGRVSFGIGDASQVLQARAEGKPLVVIASIFQRHPLAFVSLSDRNIQSPTDLIGKTAAISPQSIAAFEIMLAMAGVDRSAINMVERTNYSLDPLLTGEVDVVDGWVTSDIVQLALAGVDYSQLFPTDYGVLAYANVLYTSEDLVANNPELIAQVLPATLRGMNDAIANPTHAAEVANAYIGTQNEASLQVAMMNALPLFQPAGSRPGVMEQHVWDSMSQLLKQQTLLPNNFVIAEAYTDQFITDFYDQ